MLKVANIVGGRGGFQIGPVSFALAPGERLAIFGKSGSGKSTLLRLLSGFVPLQAGEITISNHSLRQNHSNKLPEYRRLVVYVAQQTWLWPHMTIYENVAFAPRMLQLPQAEQRVEQLLEALEIREIANRKPFNVSGGEARRATVARALAVNPEVVLFDEIETGLDPVRAQRQMELISRACSMQQLAAIIVTHSVATVERFTDHTLVLDAGRVAEFGSTAGILSTPQSPAAQELITAWRR
jgi:ABC-type multidrug transport system ATPase subunit